ncbi:hypothetical protein QEN40_16580 [Gordonia alkanivorans]|nr:hypothetical protein [Gordonia alkanivorans]MDH3042594.1 hypothetical protein [Gordonia alkanivorans]
MSEYEKVTRFEVIDHTTGGRGRVYSRHDVSIELSYQDDGRTLKVFVDDPKPQSGAVDNPSSFHR